jgi:CBS domain-containing protein
MDGASTLALCIGGEVVDIEFNVAIESVDRIELSEPLCIEPQDPLRGVLAKLKQHNNGTALVCREGVLVGIFTERDALKLLAAGADLDRPIESVMTRAPITMRPDASIGTAIRKMAAGGYRRLPIVDREGVPIGVLQTAAIVRFMVEHFPRTIYNLPPVPHAVMQQREGS